MKKTLLLIAVVVLIAVVSCSTTKIKSSPYDVGTSLADAFLAKDILNDFRSQNGRNPVVVIGLVSSSTDADETQVIRGFTNKLVSSGRIDMIVASSERDSIREERIEQLNWGNIEQAKSLANEMIADYFGRIFVTPYASGYLIAADIVEVETGRIVWSDQYNQIISLPAKAPSATTQMPAQTSQTAQATPSTPTTPAANEEKPKETTPAPTTPIVNPNALVSGTDMKVGETDKFGRTVVANLDNNVTLLKTPGGSMIFQFKLENTSMNYQDKGYPYRDWPAYINTFNIDLNDPAWADLKNKRVKFSMEIKEYSPGSGSSTSGLLSVRPSFDGNLNKLYDLSGKDSFTIEAEVRTGNIEATDLRYEIGVLLPLEVKEGASAVRITELPFVVLFDANFSPEKAYIISLRDIPETPYSNGFFSNIVTSIVGGNLTYVEGHNGEHRETKGYVQSISKHGSLFDADLYLTGIKEDFILYFNDLDYNTALFGDYGTISIKETSDTTWPEDNCIDLSSEPGGTVTITSDKAWTIIWALPEDDNSSYRVTFSTEAVGLSQKWGRYGAGGGAGRPYKDDFIISRTENTNGFVTVYSQPARESMTWKIEKIN